MVIVATGGTEYTPTEYLYGKSDKVLTQLELEKKLATIDTLLAEKTVRYEILSHHLHDALAQCGQLTGKTIQEQMFNEIFSTFCIGK